MEKVVVKVLRKDRKELRLDDLDYFLDFGMYKDSEVVMYRKSIYVFGLTAEKVRERYGDGEGVYEYEEVGCSKLRVNLKVMEDEWYDTLDKVLAMVNAQERPMIIVDVVDKEGSLWAVDVFAAETSFDELMELWEKWK